MTAKGFGDLQVGILPQAKLSDYTTFQLGGPCPRLILCQAPAQLRSVVRQLLEEKLPFILIGGGSNLVISDRGLDCIVVRYCSPTPLIERQGYDLLVSGSTSLDSLALFAINEGLEGLTYTSGIPGTVGGAIVGNAGAFGKQVGDMMKEVTVITRQGQEKKYGPGECGFSYRHSRLKETGDIVVETVFGLKQGHSFQMMHERQEILATRKEKHPDLKEYPCAGSFFRNIEPTSSAGKRQAAGWFLDQAGGKDLSVGGAYIFPKHANIIVKGKGCRAQDVFDLHLQMKRLVKEKFDLDLVREVRFVGDFLGKPQEEQSAIW